MTDTTKQVLLLVAAAIATAVIGVMFAWMTQLTTKEDVVAMIEHRPDKVTQPMLNKIGAEIKELHLMYHALNLEFKVYEAKHQ